MTWQFYETRKYPNAPSQFALENDLTGDYDYYYTCTSDEGFTYYLNDTIKQSTWDDPRQSFRGFYAPSDSFAYVAQTNLKSSLRKPVQTMSEDYSALKIRYDKLVQLYDHDISQLESQRVKDVKEKEVVIHTLQRKVDTNTVDAKEDLLLSEIDNLKYELSMSNGQLSTKVRMLSNMERELTNLTRKYEETVRHDEDDINRLKNLLEKEKQHTATLNAELNNPERISMEEKKIVELEGELSEIKGLMAAKDVLLEKEMQDRDALEHAHQEMSDMIENNRKKMQLQFEEELAEKETIIDKLKENVDSFADEREQLDHLKRSLEIVATDIRSKDSEIKQLNEQVKSEQSQNNDLLAEKQSLTAKLLEKDKMIASLQSDMEFMEKNSKETKLIQAMDKLREEIASGTETISKQKKTIKELRRKNEDITFDYNDAIAKNKQFNIAAQNQDKYIHGMKQELLAMTRENNNVKITIAEKDVLSNKLKQTTADLINIQKSHQELTKKNIEISRLLKAAQDDFARKEDQFRKLKEEQDSHKMAVSKRDSQSNMKLIEMNKLVIEQKTALIQKNAELDKYQREKKNFAKDVNDITVKYNAAVSEANANEEIITTYKDLVADYKRKLQRQEIDNGRQLALLKKDIGTGSITIIQKESEIEKLRRDLTVIQGEMSDARRAQDRLITQIKANQVKELTFRDEQITRLRNEIERLIVAANNPETLAQYQKDIQGIQEELRKSKTQIFEKEQIIQELSDSREEMGRTIKKLKTRHEQELADLTLEKDRQISALKKTIEVDEIATPSDQTNMSQQQTRLQTELNTSQKEIEKLKDVIHDAKRDYQELLARKNESELILNKDLESARARVIALEGTNKDSTALQRFADEIEKLSDVITTMKENQTTLEMEKKSALNDLEEMKSKCKMLEEVNKTLPEAVDHTADLELSKLQRDFKNLNDELDKVKTKHQQLKSENKKMIEQHSQEISSLTDKLEKAQFQLDKAGSQRGTSTPKHLKNEIAGNDVNQNMEKEKEELQKKLVKVQSDYEKMKKDSDEVKLLLSTMQTNFDKEKESIQLRHEQEISKLTESFEKRKQLFVPSNNDSDSIKLELDHVRESLRVKEEEFAKLSLDYDTFITDNEKTISEIQEEQNHRDLDRQEKFDKLRKELNDTKRELNNKKEEVNKISEEYTTLFKRAKSEKETLVNQFEEDKENLRKDFERELERSRLDKRTGPPTAPPPTRVPGRPPPTSPHPAVPPPSPPPGVFPRGPHSLPPGPQPTAPPPGTPPKLRPNH